MEFWIALLKPIKMFSGLIFFQGDFIKLEKQPSSFCLQVKAPWKLAWQLKRGDSLAVNGVCLTVTKIQGRKLSFDLLSETLSRTQFSKLIQGDKLNLEPSLRMGDRLHGHLLSGHVDTTAVLVGIDTQVSGKVYRYKLSNSKYLPMISEKGSIAVDGVSLTVSKKLKTGFEVSLIPLSLEKSNLGQRQKGEACNIEVDWIARYVIEFLQKNPFLKK